MAVAFLTLVGSASAWMLYAGGPRLVTLLQAPRQESLSPSAFAPGERPLRIDRAPLRTLEEDPSYATFFAVAVDPVRDEIVLQSANRPSILVYDRLDGTLPAAAMSKPKRMIGGPQTKIGNTGIYVDPTNGDIYSVATDRRDVMVVHSRTAEGNVAPVRELKVPHRAFAIAVDEEARELFLTRQNATVLVYAKSAKGNDAPLRTLEGPRTQLADVFGIALDAENQVMYVANRGDGGRGENSSVPGSGSFAPPSITVYPLRAAGNTPPLRVIQGPNTQLNWPGLIHLDTTHQELFVANAADDSILVFRATDRGDVAPVRVLNGTRTGLKNPYGVVVDEKSDRLVVANYGNYTATVYPRTAAGDAPPIRTIRGAPQGALVPIFSHVPALAYDSKRGEILVPSCIIHPQIAAYAKAETGQTPKRIIAGQAAKTGRAQHEIRYDEVHDEIVTVNPDAKAILTFRGGASGEEPPLRVIQGPRTQIGDLISESDVFDVDPVHDELFVPQRGSILVFSRTANGDVAPIRVISGPDTGLNKAKGQLTVDPVNNLLAVGMGSDTSRRGPSRQPQILIFNRTDQGNVKPRAVIAGPKTGLMNFPNLRAYPAKGWLLALMVGGDGYDSTSPVRFLGQEPPSVVAVWSIHDHGDVPPRFLLAGPKSQMVGNEFTLNPKGKEIIVGGTTSVRTYYVPEIF